MNTRTRFKTIHIVLVAMMTSITSQAGDGAVFKYSILDVHPTQEAVGMEAVQEKVKQLESMDHDELKKFLEKRPIPVVIAPDGKYYMIDHHHQSMAAHLAGRENAFYKVEADLTETKTMNAFWVEMKKRKWVREFDHDGKPIKIPEGLPKTVAGMKDDPYRSLAYFVREKGGYKKVDVEFAEFLWADFFRTRVPLWHSKKERKKAIKDAVKLARTPEASQLPGAKKSKYSCLSYLEYKSDYRFWNY